MESSSPDPHTPFGRLLIAYRAEDVLELAHAMGRPVNTVKSWKQRNAVPLNALTQAASETSRSLEWLTGVMQTASRGQTSTKPNLSEAEEGSGTFLLHAEKAARELQGFNAPLFIKSMEALEERLQERGAVLPAHQRVRLYFALYEASLQEDDVNRAAIDAFINLAIRSNTSL
ncbi:MAG: helix-turn-helix domain-containing protein [Rubrivivax sp.]